MSRTSAPAKRRENLLESAALFPGIVMLMPGDQRLAASYHQLLKEEQRVVMEMVSFAPSHHSLLLEQQRAVTAMESFDPPPKSRVLPGKAGQAVKPLPSLLGACPASCGADFLLAPIWQLDPAPPRVSPSRCRRGSAGCL